MIRTGRSDGGPLGRPLTPNERAVGWVPAPDSLTWTTDDGREHGSCVGAVPVPLRKAIGDASESQQDVIDRLAATCTCPDDICLGENGDCAACHEIDPEWDCLQAVGAVPVPLRKAIGDAIDRQQVAIIREYLAHDASERVGSRLRCTACGEWGHLNAPCPARGEADR